MQENGHAADGHAAAATASDVAPAVPAATGAAVEEEVAIKAAAASEVTSAGGVVENASEAAPEGAADDAAAAAAYGSVVDPTATGAGEAYYAADGAAGEADHAAGYNDADAYGEPGAASEGVAGAGVYDGSELAPPAAVYDDAGDAFGYGAPAAEAPFVAATPGGDVESAGTLHDVFADATAGVAPTEVAVDGAAQHHHHEPSPFHRFGNFGHDSPADMLADAAAHGMPHPHPHDDLHAAEAAAAAAAAAHQHHLHGGDGMLAPAHAGGDAAHVHDAEHGAGHVHDADEHGAGHAHEDGATTIAVDADGVVSQLPPHTPHTRGRPGWHTPEPPHHRHHAEEDVNATAGSDDGVKLGNATDSSHTSNSSDNATAPIAPAATPTPLPAVVVPFPPFNWTAHAYSEEEARASLLAALSVGYAYACSVLHETAAAGFDTVESVLGLPQHALFSKLHAATAPRLAELRSVWAIVAEAGSSVASATASFVPDFVSVSLVAVLRPTAAVLYLFALAAFALQLLCLPVTCTQCLLSGCRRRGVGQPPVEQQPAPQAPSARPSSTPATTAAPPTAPLTASSLPPPPAPAFAPAGSGAPASPPASGAKFFNPATGLPPRPGGRTLAGGAGGKGGGVAGPFSGSATQPVGGRNSGAPPLAGGAGVGGDDATAPDSANRRRHLSRVHGATVRVRTVSSGKANNGGGARDSSASPSAALRTSAAAAPPSGAPPLMAALTDAAAAGGADMDVTAPVSDVAPPPAGVAGGSEAAWVATGTSFPTEALPAAAVGDAVAAGEATVDPATLLQQYRAAGYIDYDGYEMRIDDYGRLVYVSLTDPTVVWDPSNAAATTTGEAAGYGGGGDGAAAYAGYGDGSAAAEGGAGGDGASYNPYAAGGVPASAI